MSTRAQLRCTGLRMHIALVAVCILFLLPGGVAAQQSNAAGMLVHFGGDRITYAWVPLPEGEITALDLLERTDLDLVTLEFGALGTAICQIETTGCGPDACRTRMCQTSSSSPFWRFLKLQDGEWKMMGTGVAGATVKPGDVYALSWSATTPALPALDLPQLAEKVGADDDAVATVLLREGEQLAEDRASWMPVTIAGGGVVIAAGVLVIRAKAVRERAA